MLRLRDIMTTDVITVTPESSLREAMELFAAHHISGAPVVTGSKVVGVISANDIIAFATTAPEPEEDREVGSGEWVYADDPVDDAGTPRRRLLAELWTITDDQAQEDDTAPAATEWDPLGDYTVSDAMTWGVCGLPPTTDVVAAAEQMRSADVHRLLVMDEGHLLGIVTTMDIVRAVAENRLVRRTYVFDRGRGS
ncbi:MAG TPA: CBS domain-containing protein [Gemmatimonadales bacterium]